MIKYLLLPSILLLLSFAHLTKDSEELECTAKNERTLDSLVTDDYELIIPEEQKGLLILFPGFPSNAGNIKASFPIVEAANKNGISLLLMNFNRHLFLQKSETLSLAIDIEQIINKHELKDNNVYIGGMSSGGNVALLLSNLLLKDDFKIKPKGVFVVDSPIDLYGLYESSLKDLSRKDFSEERLAEPRWLINYFESEFGQPDTIFESIQQFSPFTLKNNNIQNILELQNIKTRFYTEPDTSWWKEERQTEYEDINAYYIKGLCDHLSIEGWGKFEYIATENKGYRSNGERNPHSWSIIDEEELIKWILEE